MWVRRQWRCKSEGGRILKRKNGSVETFRWIVFFTIWVYFQCFDVGRHRLLHVFGRPFLGIVWVGNRYPAPQTPWTARCNFFGYSLQIKQVYDTLAFWCAASVWNYYILWYIGLLVLLGFKKPWLDVKNGISRNHLTISRLAKPVSNGKGVSVCSVCETGGDICWTNQEIVITVYTIY